MTLKELVKEFNKAGYDVTNDDTIVNSRGDVEGFVDGHGTFHTKNEEVGRILEKALAGAIKKSTPKVVKKTTKKEKKDKK